MPPQLVLASASPRRRALLSQLGIEFTVRTSDVPEVPASEERATDYVRRVAAAKAEVIARAVPGAIVLAADTEVVLDERPLGKPKDPGEARAMLRALSGRAHEVITGVAVRGGARPLETIVRTRVTFAALTDARIDWYVGTGEPFDKAGGYGIQERGGSLVASVEGSASNVIGLPLEETLALLHEAGVALPWGDR